MVDNIFDFSEGQRRRDQGRDLAANNRQYRLKIAQRIAEEVGQKLLFVTADDVYAAMCEQGLGEDYEALENARGSLFKKKCWIWTGEYVLSKRPSRHANSIRVWMYYPDQ